MPEPIAAFSDVPASIEAVLTDHLEELLHQPGEQPLAADLVRRFVDRGMTAQLMVNNTLGGPDHHVVQAFGDDDIFYIDPEWTRVGEVANAELAEPASQVLCYRTAEVQQVAAWFGSIVEASAVPLDEIVSVAAHTWDPLNYRAVVEPRVMPTYNL